MEQYHSWEANSSSASRETTAVIWNSNVYCRFHNSPPLVHILSHINPVHAIPSCFSKICFKSYHIRLGFPSDFFLQVSPAKSGIHFSIRPHKSLPLSSHYALFVGPLNMRWAIQITKLLIMSSPPLSCVVLRFRPIDLSHLYTRTSWADVLRRVVWKVLGLTVKTGIYNFKIIFIF